MALVRLAARTTSPLLRAEAARVGDVVYHVRAVPTGASASFWLTIYCVSLGGPQSAEGGSGGDNGRAMAGSVRGESGAGAAAGAEGEVSASGQTSQAGLISPADSAETGDLGAGTPSDGRVSLSALPLCPEEGAQGLVLSGSAGATGPMAIGLRVPGYREHAVCAFGGELLLAVASQERALQLFRLRVGEAPDGRGPSVSFSRVDLGWNYVTSCEGFALAQAGPSHVMFAGGYRSGFVRECARVNLETAAKESAPVLDTGLAGATLVCLFPQRRGVPEGLRETLLLFGGAGEAGFRPHCALTEARGARWGKVGVVPCSGGEGGEKDSDEGDWACCWVCDGMAAAVRLGKRGALYLGYYRKTVSLLGLSDEFLFTWERVASVDLSALSPECFCTYSAGFLLFSGGEGAEGESDGEAQRRKMVHALPLGALLPEASEARKVLAGGYYAQPEPQGVERVDEAPVSTKEGLFELRGKREGGEKREAGRADQVGRTGGAEGARGSAGKAGGGSAEAAAAARAAGAAGISDAPEPPPVARKAGTPAELDSTLLRSILSRLGQLEREAMSWRVEAADARAKAADALSRCEALEKERNLLAKRLEALEASGARSEEGKSLQAEAGHACQLDQADQLDQAGRPDHPGQPDRRDRPAATGTSFSKHIATTAHPAIRDEEPAFSSVVLSRARPARHASDAAQTFTTLCVLRDDARLEPPCEGPSCDSTSATLSDATSSPAARYSENERDSYST